MNNAVVLGSIPFIDSGASSSVYYYYILGLLKYSESLNLIIVNNKINKNDLNLFIKSFNQPSNLNITILSINSAVSFVPWSRHFYIYKIFSKKIYFKNEFDNVVIFDSDLGFLNLKFNTKKNILWLGDLSFELEWFNFIEKYKKSFLSWIQMLFFFINKILFYKIVTSKFNKIVCCSLTAQNRLSRININAEFQPFPYPSRNRKNPFLFTNQNIKPRKFLFYGNLIGSGSNSGLKFLFNEILPNARKVWGINNFEIFIGGRTKLPQVYEKNLSHYSEVKYLGFINDLDSTLNQFTALLIPISLPLGNRTRVLDGLSFGIPVVGHKAICGGNPFLVDGINCALAKTGSEFISKLDKICEDSNYRNNIISNGILTYDLTYNPKNDHILQLLN